MLKTLPTPPGLLFGSFLFRADQHSQADLAALWSKTYGPSDVLIPTSNPLIDYYAKEMGDPLERFLIITQSAYPREQLLKSKLQGIEWENQFAVDGKRTVNVDTGLLSLENFILATTKNYSHRVYIGSDIFADLTYEFKQGAFQFLPWTYPDYRDPEKTEFLKRARTRLLASSFP